MPDEKTISKIAKLPGWVFKLLDLPWVEILGELLKYGRKFARGLVNEGVYETLEYESTLEIHNKKGTRATFSKRKKIRYLQDNIIAYQDYGWGDGEILLDYKTNRGKAVDFYRSGYKTYILLSLREVKTKGNVDEFNIQWKIRNGFLTEDGYWATDISNRTKKVKINTIFPKSRPPQYMAIEESYRQRNRVLGPGAKRKLADGRWRVMWEMKNPKLYEIYVLRWVW